MTDEEGPVFLESDAVTVLLEPDYGEHAADDTVCCPEGIVRRPVDSERCTRSVEDDRILCRLDLDLHRGIRIRTDRTRHRELDVRLLEVEGGWSTL